MKKTSKPSKKPSGGGKSNLPAPYKKAMKPQKKGK